VDQLELESGGNTVTLYTGDKYSANVGYGKIQGQ